jgi:hypothetical protein
MNIINNIKNKISNIYSFFRKENKKEIILGHSLEFINNNCINDGYNCTFIELENNSCLDLYSNGILITFLPRNNVETLKYGKFIKELIQDSFNNNKMNGKKKIIIKNGLNNKFVFITYNYEIIGKLRYYLESLDKTYNLVVITNEEF